MNNMWKYFEGKIVILFFIFAWEIIGRSGLINPLFLPPFSKVMVTLWELLLAGNFSANILISLQRAVLGFILGTVIAIPLGFFLSACPYRLQLALRPLFRAAEQANPFILFHVVILFAGIGEPAKTVIIVWVCLWPILFSICDGIKNTDSGMLKIGTSFGLSRWQLFTKITVPAVLPSIFTGLRISSGYSFFLLVVIEMMGSNSGLGWFILSSQENYNINWIYAGAVTIAILAVLIDLILKSIEGKLLAGRYPTAAD
ncbi:ABC transporter permease [Pectinatus haikarae]|nr:ABC transporter permease [Pectinatus haikarae]